MAVPHEAAFGQWKSVEIYHPRPLQRARSKIKGDWHIRCGIRGPSNIQQAKHRGAMASVVARRWENPAFRPPRSVADYEGVGEVVSADIDEELFGYICSGPLLKSCEFSPDDVKEHFQRWVELGDVLIGNLGFPSKAELTPAQRMRIYQYYLPIFFWCEAQMAQYRRQESALVIGIQAPQGCGKTTLVEELKKLFEYTGRKAVAISVDDFYLTYRRQVELAKANPGNKLLQLRGNPGTHDLTLGLEVLGELAEPVDPDVVDPANPGVKIPRYDKSRHGGKGDRTHPKTWPVVQDPVDVILFEGWMLGFSPLSDEEAAAVSEDLVEVNSHLKGYRFAWDRWVESWLVIRVADPKWVYKWRLEAEHAMRAEGKTGMTDEEVADFVDRYMPAYTAYLPGMYKHGPTSCRPGRLLTVEIGEDRSLLPQQPAPVFQRPVED